MENLNFADKVNKAFEDGWKSNPQFSKALKEIEQIVEDKTISVADLFRDNSHEVAQTREDDDEAR